jgi:hypothetical protein
MGQQVQAVEMSDCVRNWGKLEAVYAEPNHRSLKSRPGRSGVGVYKFQETPTAATPRAVQFHLLEPDETEPENDSRKK